MGRRWQPAGPWAGTTAAHSQKGAWQEAGGQGRPAPVRRTDFHHREGKGSAPSSQDANPSRGHAPDLITSQKSRLLRHPLGTKVFNLEILRGGHSLRPHRSSNTVRSPVLEGPLKGPIPTCVNAPAWLSHRPLLSGPLLTSKRVCNPSAPAGGGARKIPNSQQS